MSLDVFNAVIAGYSDYLIDMQTLAVQTGFWSAYYQSKRPKKIQTIVSNLLKNKFNKNTGSTITTEADIEQYKQRELKRMATYNRWEQKNG